MRLRNHWLDNSTAELAAILSIRVQDGEVRVSNSMQVRNAVNLARRLFEVREP
jgi:hypothetical protein